MPDSYLLSLGGTQVDVASFTRADPGPDFGGGALRRAHFVEGPHTEGVLSHEESLVRRMRFPLILGASRSISNLGLEDAEALLRKLARPGAVVDVKPQGATTAVRFDVLAGRYDLDYSVHHNREGIRLGTLELQTKPYGYWPTMILLASVASIGLPGFLTWSGSIIGDAPGLAKIAVQPTVATNVQSGSWMTDFAALAISHRASHLSHLRAPSLALLNGASLLGEAVAPASQSIRYAASQRQADWKQVTRYVVASELEPAYRGRYRAYGWFRIQPSQGLPWRVSLDAVPEQLAGVAALGSYAPIATVSLASPAYQLLDLGEVALPAVGSGMGGGQALRVWMAPATTNVGVASPVIGIGGLFVLPLDSDFAGVMPQGMAVPTTSAPSAGRLVLDSPAGQALLSGYGLDLATAQPWGNAWQHYRGPLPRVASGVRVDLLGGMRETFPGDYAQGVGSDNPKAHFRFEEVGGAQLVDARGSWHGSYVNAPLFGVEGRVQRGVQFDGVNDYALAPSLLHAWATSWTIDFWLKRPEAIASRLPIVHQGDLSNSQSLWLYVSNSGQMVFSFFADDLVTPGDLVGRDSEYHHWQFAWDYAARGGRIFRDGLLAASAVFTSTYQASGPLNIARETAGTYYSAVSLDELGVYVGSAFAEDIARERYRAGQGGPLQHSGPAHASVSVSYRPRFQFVKGL